MLHEDRTIIAITIIITIIIIIIIIITIIVLAPDPQAACILQHAHQGAAVCIHKRRRLLPDLGAVWQLHHQPQRQSQAGSQDLSRVVTAHTHTHTPHKSTTTW